MPAVTPLDSGKKTPVNEKDVLKKIIVTRKPDSRLLVTWSACEWQYTYSSLKKGLKSLK